MIGVVCPVPMASCSGAVLDAGNCAKRVKYHQTHDEVLNCEGRHLVAQGYTRLSRKEYRPPNGGEILLLSRKPGARVRKGKQGRSMGDFHENGGLVAW
jgi:hypothetical protein